MKNYVSFSSCYKSLRKNFRNYPYSCSNRKEPEGYGSSYDLTEAFVSLHKPKHSYYFCFPDKCFSQFVRSLSRCDGPHVVFLPCSLHLTGLQFCAFVQIFSLLSINLLRFLHHSAPHLKVKDFCHFMFYFCRLCTVTQ